MSTENPPTASTAIALDDRTRRAIELREAIGQEARPSAIVPRTFAEAQSFAGALALSSLVPDALRERAPDILMIVLAGSELGIPPVKALGVFHVIEGVPKLSADGLAAIVSASALCEYLEPREQSATKVTWAAKKYGRPEVVMSYTREDAELAGLFRPSRNGNPSNHQKFPRQMLNARCKADLCRIVWPEICAGLLSAEEARDIVQAREADANRAGFQAPPPPALEVAPSSAPAAVAAPKAEPAKAAAPKAAAKAPKASPPPAAAKAPIDTTATEVAPSSSAPAPTNPLPPDPAREAAFAKARGEAPPAEVPPVEAPAAAEEDTFGDDEDAEEAAPPAMTFELFEEEVRACVEARSAAELEKVKARWLPWSKDDTASGGRAHAPKMRDAFAKAKAELGNR